MVNPDILGQNSYSHRLNRTRRASVIRRRLEKGLHDFPYTFASRIIPVLLLSMILISLVEIISTPSEIDCQYLTPVKRDETLAFQKKLNNYCMTYDTFLVKKALNPKMRGKLTFPGVDTYEPDKDQIIIQHYYKNMVLYLMVLFVLSYLPHAMFAFRGKIDGFCMVNHQECDIPNCSGRSETEQFLDAFALAYTSKVLAIITATFQIGFTVFFFGDSFFYYGLDVLLYAVDSRNLWPNPMDAVFPKVTKCEVREYVGETDDIEVKAALCKLPFNDTNQWVLFVYWWAIIFSLVLNLWSLSVLIMKMCYIAYSTTKINKIIAVALVGEKINAEINSIEKFMKEVKRNACVKIQMNFEEDTEERCNQPIYPDGEQELPTSESLIFQNFNVNPYSPPDTALFI